MKSFLLLTLCSVSIAIAQPNTDIFLMNLEFADSTFTLSNIQNISNADGYDNQPSFYDNNTLLYAGSANGQTDIKWYDIASQRQRWYNEKTAGGEYSPTAIPNSNRIAAVRLDTTGLQRLYAYDLKEAPMAQSELLLEDVEVAYFAFNDEQYMMASILAGAQLDLILIDLKNKTVIPYAEKAGRSIHKVPGSKSMSYTIVNEDKNHDVYLVDIKNAEETYFACQLPIGIQDHTWLNRDTLLIGSGSKLYTYNLFGEGVWEEVADLSANGITNITRIAVSPDGRYLSFAAEVK